MVAETAWTGPSLADYFAPVFGGQCASDGTVSLAAGENKVCTITNTRRPTRSEERRVGKESKSGLFNLRIDGSAPGTGANAACGGTTGAVPIALGSHTVTETAGTGTSLADYFTPVIGGQCASDGTVSLAAGENKVCTITNTRRPT